jgi:2-hydroxycyclohexanecarboxyl-CoA dehydrogenase
MELGIKGKTVIITGGGSHIGRGIAQAFGEEGANVVIFEIDEGAGQKTVDMIKADGGNAVVIQTDITKHEEVEASVKKTIDQFNTVDILVNNAGWTIDRLFIEKPRDEWEKEIDINLWGVINCFKAVLGPMIEKKYGHIVSIASDAGRMGEFREAVYAAAKAGVIGLTKAVAREVGRYGINLNVVCPGANPPTGKDDISKESLWVPIFELLPDGMPDEQLQKMAKNYPMRRLGTPQDVAKAAVFLASDAASYITGQTVSVSGGYTMI